ncbi:GNAT superfamily N-acetyltransferase [Halorubrum alkaliphilum]|uniref:GNAT superfamily N-acetyltransferase n=1 Tax=Halorubrum alkaliphilum TaxID=261290 RepID=A0A8T4GBZ8_9EURY|nr:GNAT family N-acetyltransferase [Halorubrum alkaliphilum]MBP1921626.1 GNAT superfamily N-acetyltransferase [Halorubrum alkaliphilum]
MGRVTVRQAREPDAEAVAAFTGDTWGERHDDYIPRVFAEWVASDDETQRTFVATVDPADLESIAGSEGVGDPTVVTGDGTGAAASGEPEAVVGCVQGVLLSEWESWAQGIRVTPAARGLGVGSRLSEAVLDWARSAGATVCRNMVFSWNVAGLGQSRAVGFDPGTEFRFARPDPAAAPASRPEGVVDDPDPDAVWAFWSRSDARDHLDGLGLDPGESWSCSQLTRERLATAADEDRLIAIRNDGIAAFALHTRVWERAGDDEGGDGERNAIYGNTAWRDAETAEQLLDAIARDAAERDADNVRAFIPETVDHVSDVAASRVDVSAEPDFVMTADLTDR